MAKKVITITIDEGIYQTLRTKNENISKLINDFLITYSGVSREELQENKAKMALMKKKAEIAVLEDNLIKIQKLKEEQEKERGVQFEFGKNYQ